MEQNAFSGILILGVILVLVKQISKRRERARLLPGPPGYPFIGNFFDIPRSYAGDGFAEIAKKYGKIFYVSFLGQKMIVLNSQKLASDIMGAKGESSAGRPPLTMASDLCGYDRFLALMQPGARHRRGRDFIVKAVGSRRAAAQYATFQEAEVVRFLKRLLVSPENFGEHITWIIGSCLLLFTHGYTAKDHEDPVIKCSSQVLLRFANATAAGRWLVDLIPAMRYIPDWFPGATFKQIAKYDRKFAKDSFRMPFDMVKKQMKEGTARPSLVAYFLEEVGDDCTEEDEDFIMFTAGDIYGAGIGTTSSALEAFFLAMVLNPDVQERAQAEIDAHCECSSRLPKMADKPYLPYTEALVTEVLRWSIITPLGIPHRFTKEETYGEWVFPKGTYVYANMSAISQDPDEYPEPHKFNPERFLGPVEKRQLDPREISFGYGRRQCMGVPLSGQIMFTVIASTLATFKIEPKEGETYSPAYTDGVICHRVPFKCNIHVRSPQARALIQDP